MDIQIDPKKYKQACRKLWWLDKLGLLMLPFILVYVQVKLWRQKK